MDKFLKIHKWLKLTQEQNENLNSNRKIKSNDSYYLLKKSNSPAVIVECGFLSNKSEMSKLSTHIYQSDIAQGIVKGLVAYIEEK